MEKALILTEDMIYDVFLQWKKYEEGGDCMSPAEVLELSDEEYARNATDTFIALVNNIDEEVENVPIYTIKFYLCSDGIARLPVERWK